MSVATKSGENAKKAGEDRHKHLWQALTAVAGTSAVLGGLVLYALGRSDHAIEKAHEINTVFRAHEEGQEEAVKRIDSSLIEIKVEQSKQRGMIEDLWKKGNGG